MVNKITMFVIQCKDCYNITRNKHFKIIERPGLIKHLLTLNNRYQCQQRLQKLCLNDRGHPETPD